MSASRSASCCTFTFSDGRHCRTPRQPGHPLFCCFHARKLEQSHITDQLGRELARFFSRDYLSACDLNAALARLFTATARGHVPPKTTRALAYLAQVMVQTLRLAEHEYINAFSTDGWRRSIRSSVHSNSGFPSPAAPPCSAGFTPASSSSATSARPIPPRVATPQNAPPSTQPAAPLPPHRTVVAGLQTGSAPIVSSGLPRRPASVVARLQPGSSPSPSQAPQPDSQPPITSSNQPRLFPHPLPPLNLNSNNSSPPNSHFPHRRCRNHPLRYHQLQSPMSQSPNLFLLPFPRSKRARPLLPQAALLPSTMTTIATTTSRVSSLLPLCGGESGAPGSSASRGSTRNPCRTNTSAAAP